MLALCGGVFLGLVFGFLPGLGGTAGLALLLPFLYGIEPSIALAMMIGLQSVTATSDTFPSVLMGIPGTASSQATVMDGFPMSKKGEAARALSAAFISSLFGGLFGAVILTGAIIVAIPVLMAVGFAEQMMLIILSLTMIGMLTGVSALKGMAACALGLVIAVVGAAPMSGEYRLDFLDFGTGYLTDPIRLVIVGLAMFAVPEIVDLLRRQMTISESGKLGAGWVQGLKDWLDNWWLSLRCSVIGCICGALPGLGGSVIDWIAYGHAVQSTKNPERYGTGDVRGVIAPESANNAKEGGALIPTLLFGIPGSGSMALLLGGFILIGIEPGIQMITTDLDLVYVMIWSVALANIVGAGTCVLLAGQIAKLTTIRYALVAPFMFALIYFAAFQATRHWGDLILLTILGTLGVYMKRFGWPRPALLIGFVLGPLVEQNVYVATSVHGWSLLEKPIVILLLVLTALSAYAAYRFKPHRPLMTEDSPHTHIRRWPQLIFYGVLLTIVGTVLFDSFRHEDRLTTVYPWFSVAVALIFLIPIGIQMFLRQSPDATFYDSEREEFSNDLEYRSSEHYLLWLLGLLAGAALFGFVIGIALFMFTFVRMKAGLKFLPCALFAGIFVIFLGVLQDLMTLEYPMGLLQTWLEVQLPWPLQ
jgi:putative tricarboxylic transport membrane protein